MQVEPCGDAAVLLRLAEHPSPRLSQRIAHLRTALLAQQPAGLLEAVPGFVTLLLTFDPDRTDAATLAAAAQAAARRPQRGAAARRWTLPVCYHPSLAPDLDAVARATGLTAETVAQRHAGVEYTVHLLGFSPGFPYCGTLPPELVLPRRADPRPRIAAGSVAIATAYTAIYPQATPGGWHLIGRTPVVLFDAAATAPALLAPGDTLRFTAVSLDAYADLAADVAAGRYRPSPEAEPA